MRNDSPLNVDYSVEDKSYYVNNQNVEVDEMVLDALVSVVGELWFDDAPDRPNGWILTTFRVDSRTRGAGAAIVRHDGIPIGPDTSEVDPEELPGEEEAIDLAKEEGFKRVFVK